MSKTSEQAATFDAVIVGAGFAGLYMLHRLRQQGLKVTVIEAGDDVGGTWYWNRYPGARCDVESMQYSYSFSEELQQEWRWSERYAPQAEILSYISHVADRFDLRRDISFGTRVTAATFDNATSRWLVQTDKGDTISAQFCIMATGALSAARIPDIPDLASFAGPTYHTAEWPKDGVDFTGQRVGVIGTGSTAIQLIPVVARQAAHLFVFQRTPNFSLPARNEAMQAEYETWWKANYPELRRKAREEMRSGTIYNYGTRAVAETTEQERLEEFEARWQQGGIAFMHSFKDLMLDMDANQTAAEFVRAKIRATVNDPATAAALSPTDYPIGTKRICLDTQYFETYNRDNVTLVDLRATPIEALTETGLRTENADYQLDAIIFATGFDAMTGSLLAMDIKGRDGISLRDKWAEGPRNYLGLMVHGFPNLFTVTGPGSPSVLSNVVHSIEQHVDWLADCIAYLRQHGITRMEPQREAEDRWVDHVREIANTTLYPKAASWYMGANIPGKPRVFLPYVGGTNTYRRLCDEVAAEGYRGFTLEQATRHAATA
jgi:cyclohexanone monooxygenase